MIFGVNVNKIDGEAMFNDNDLYKFDKKLERLVNSFYIGRTLEVESYFNIITTTGIPSLQLNSKVRNVSDEKNVVINIECGSVPINNNFDEEFKEAKKFILKTVAQCLIDKKIEKLNDDFELDLDIYEDIFKDNL